MSKERIANKVRKLMAIAGDGSASEAEIQNAMNHANRLIGEHHLTKDDLNHEPQDDYDKVDSAEFNDFRTYVGKKQYAWEHRLAMFVSRFVGVSVYADWKIRIVRGPDGFARFCEKTGEPLYGKSFVYYGVAEDSAIAVDLFNELRQLIATLAVARWGSVFRGDGEAYSEGFVTGLNTQLEKANRIEQQGTDSTALVLSHRRRDLIRYKQDKARDWLKAERGIKLRAGTNKTGSAGSWEARSEGVRDGKSADVSAARRRKLN